MLHYLTAARAWLSAINPDLPAAVFVVIVFLLVLGIRKVFPLAWERWAMVVPVLAIDPNPALVLLSKFWQAVPAAVIGSVLAALQSGADVKATVYGALLALLAPVAHELAKNYRGAIGRAKPPSTPPWNSTGNGSPVRAIPAGGPLLPREADEEDTVAMRGAPALLVLCVLALLPACTALKPPCDEAKLRAIDAAYVARVTIICLPRYESKEDCREWPALQAEHRAELRRECGGGAQ